MESTRLPQLIFSKRLWFFPVLLMLFVSGPGLPLMAQQTIPPDSLRVLERELEWLLEQTEPDDETEGQEDLAGFLLDLASNPLNINRASVQELAQVPGISLAQAQAIVARRGEKPFESLEELLQIRGIGRVSLDRIRPYVTVGSSAELARMLLTSPAYWTYRGRFEYISRGQRVLETQAGFTPPEFEGQTRYAGGPWRVYQRFNYRSRHLSLNLTQLKAPGEPLSRPYDFDFNSWHAGIQNVGMVRRFVVGDYGIWAGQGLVLHTGLGFGKGRDVSGGPLRAERGLAPYQSSEQTRFMRGVAATVGRQLQLTGFYSSRPLSASVIDGETIRFPSASGFHRTPTERERRNNTRLDMAGGRITYSGRYGMIGTTGYHAAYNRYIVPGDALHNRYDFEGRQASAFGADYRLLLAPLYFFGEAARSRNGGTGLISGLQYPLGEGTDITIIYRNYARDFQSLFGSAFGEGSGRPRNEEGLYTGLTHRFSRLVSTGFYYDRFRFPAPRFGTTQATSGYDMLGYLDFRFSRQFSVYFVARSKIRENDYEVTDAFGRALMARGQDARTSMRAEAEYQVLPQLRLRTRAEWVRARNRDAQSPDYGVLLFQDVRWNPLPALTVDLRLAVFETDSFASRIFMYENDLLYVFSNTMLSGTGQRAYALLRYTTASRFDFWLKYGLTVFEDRSTTGSGLTEAQGNVRSQIGLQMRVRI
ncbi:MAG: helix-hairpin-helix domain-containing protein [Balneolales bacterium]|nr:helix-hairpin-helix domain-containing protein [Balneolales bacterium]